jgi:hypothetical protein
MAITLGWKCPLGTQTGLFCIFMRDVEKSIITMAPGANVKHCFSVSLNVRPSKLEHWFIASLS